MKYLVPSLLLLLLGCSYLTERGRDLQKIKIGESGYIIRYQHNSSAFEGDGKPETVVYQNRSNNEEHKICVSRYICFIALDSGKLYIRGMRGANDYFDSTNTFGYEIVFDSSHYGCEIFPKDSMGSIRPFANWKRYDTVYRWQNDKGEGLTNVLINHYSNGAMAPYKAWTVLNGKREGLYRQYSSNGSLFTEGNYKNGLKTGRWTYNDYYGEPWRDSSFVNDSLTQVILHKGNIAR